MVEKSVSGSPFHCFRYEPCDAIVECLETSHFSCGHAAVVNNFTAVEIWMKLSRINAIRICLNFLLTKTYDWARRGVYRLDDLLMLSWNLLFDLLTLSPELSSIQISQVIWAWKGTLAFLSFVVLFSVTDGLRGMGHVKEQSAFSPRRCSLHVVPASASPRTHLVTCVGPVSGPTCVNGPTRTLTRGPAVQLVAPPCTNAVPGVELARAHRGPTSISLARDSAS